MKEFTESAEVSEWQESLTWFEPSKIDLISEELHWQKINLETARQSFEALSRMRPFLNQSNLQTEANRRHCRDRLSELTDEKGHPRFDNQDLRFFDLYFGGDRIKVTQDGSKYDFVNGRHRLRAAQLCGVKELPVLLEKKVKNSEISETDMSRLELSDIEKETQERAEGTDEMQSEVEKHQERAEKLVADLDEVRSVLAEVGSDKLREAESRLEQAREDTKKQLEKLKDRRDRMIEENQKMEQKLVEQNEKRRSASEKMARMKMMFEGASSEFKDEINRASDALTKDLEHFSEAQESLRAVHQKLDEMNFEMKTN